MNARPHSLAFLPKFLFETDRLKSRYVVRAWLLALLPSILLSGLIGMLLPQARVPDIPTEGSVSLLLLIVVAPLVESIIMGIALLGLTRFLEPGKAVIASAILWGVVHSLSAPAWGLVIWWPFLILSAAFLTWRDKGFLTALAIVTVIHGLQNTVGALLLMGTSFAA